MSISVNLAALMRSSKDSNWGTPLDFFRKIDSIFNFNLDVCATADNAKTELYISPEQDSFSVPWTSRGVPMETVAWMNPPYGKGEKACWDTSKCKKKSCVKRGYHIYRDIPGIGNWIKYGINQVKICSTGILVMLLPARTDSKWFQDVWDNACLICFVRGRVTFVGAKDTAPFPSVVAVFAQGNLNDVIYEKMSSLGNVVDSRNSQIIVYGGKR